MPIDILGGNATSLVAMMKRTGMLIVDTVSLMKFLAINKL